MNGGLAFVLRMAVIVALLYLAWQQTKPQRDQHRSEKKAAIANCRPVVCGPRSACDEAAGQLAERGIRSWSARSEGTWILVVDEHNRQEALRVLGVSGETVAT